MLRYKGYTATIGVDVEAGILCGKVLDINDEITFEGKTVGEAVQEFHRSVDEYLAFCQKIGQDPDKPFSGKLPFRTTPEIHRSIYLAASQVGKSINAWMEEMLSKSAERLLHDEDARKDPIPSPRVQLLSQAEVIPEIVAAVQPFLKSKEPYATLQFIDAVEEFLNGVDAIEPFINLEDTDAITQVVVRVIQVLSKVNIASSSEWTTSEAQTLNETPPDFSTLKRNSKRR
jgi:predicted HicB family RNase H-like nuclease